MKTALSVVQGGATAQGPQTGETWKPQQPWPTKELPVGCYDIPTFAGLDGRRVYSFGVRGTECRSEMYATPEECVRQAWCWAYEKALHEVVGGGTCISLSTGGVVEAVGATTVWLRVGQHRVTVPMRDVQLAWRRVNPSVLVRVS